MEISCGIYMLCAERRYPNGKQPRHYIGSSASIGDRLYQHRTAPNVRLLQVLRDAGIDWECVRVWVSPRFATYSERLRFERALKNGGHYNNLCPHCNPLSFARFARFENIYDGSPDPADDTPPPF